MSLIYNDKQRKRARNMGGVPVSGPCESVGLGIGPNNTTKGPTTKKELMEANTDSSQILWPWMLYVGREHDTKSWTVRRYKYEHSCL